MFGPGGGGGWNILGPGAESLLEKERAPPPRPLPLSFPKYTPPRTTHPLSRRRMISFRSTLLRQKRPTDVCDGLLAHLNIHLENDVPLSSPDFIPSISSPFIQRPYLYDSELDAMLAELSIENEDAFRELMRLPPLEGKKKPRLAYSRNFFASLEDISHYYDDSRDQYYEIEVDGGEEGKKETGTNGKSGQDAKSNEASKEVTVDDDGDSKMVDGNLAHRPPASHPTASGNDLSSLSTSISTNANSNSPQSSSPSATNSKTTKKVYKGNRLGNSLSLPPTIRTSLVRNLLKMAIHTFNCRDYDPSGRERLRIKDVNIPQGLVGCTFEVVMTPRDVKLARSRVVEGPVLGIAVKHEVVWHEEERGTGEGEGNGVNGEGGATSAGGPAGGKEFVGEKFDLAREVGAMFHVGLQRSREGLGTKEEKLERESKDWWWAKNQRWGGGQTKWGQLPYEVWEDEDPSWSPKERELQMEKRREAEEEMKLSSNREGNGSGKEIKIGDLMAGTAKPSSSGPAENSQETMESGPPKKKNRITERPRRSIGGRGGGNDNGNENSRGSKKGEGEGEIRDGRRVMYVAPLRKKWYKDWETIRPNASNWDEKMLYKRIGSPEDAKWDDIFQVSCVNHHVALVKMRVSKRYLRWVETGEVEGRKKEKEADQEDILRMWRSKWFDVFEVEARKEFLEGIWKLMGWLCREDVPKAEWEKTERLKGEREAGAVAEMEK